MEGLKRRFTSFGTWIGGILLAIVLLPKEMGHQVMIGFTLIWLAVKLSDPIWKLTQKGWRKLAHVRAIFEAKGGEDDSISNLKSSITELTDLVQSTQWESISAATDMSSYERSTMVDRQLCARITEKLQTQYPFASWSWITDDRPCVLASNCAVGRIQTEGTDMYNQCEVRFLANGQIGINMMSVKDFEQIKTDNDAASMTIEQWYETKALPLFRDCINELFSRGIKTMKVTEQGEMMARDKGKQKQCGILPNMPTQSDWPRWIELMAEDDIKAVIEANHLQLSWGISD